MNNQKIEVGQIWQVESDTFYATVEETLRGVKRTLGFHIKKGDKFEIRFPFAWNYRTECNFYVHSKTDYILDNCKLFGTVKEDVKSNNKASLEEILRLNLYNIHQK